jgi:hypothetical protein
MMLPGDPNGSLSFDNEGNVSVEAVRAPCIGIANLAQVVDYRIAAIAAIAGSISYHVRFHNGGELNYAFNEKGELLELSGKGMDFAVSPEGSFMFQASEVQGNGKPG